MVCFQTSFKFLIWCVKEHRRRNSPVKVILSESTYILIIGQADFLGHEKHKFQLIQLLGKQFGENCIPTSEARADADILIVNTTISLMKEQVNNK